MKPHCLNPRYSSTYCSCTNTSKAKTNLFLRQTVHCPAKMDLFPHFSSLCSHCCCCCGCMLLGRGKGNLPNELFLALAPCFLSSSSCLCSSDASGYYCNDACASVKVTTNWTMSIIRPIEFNSTHTNSTYMLYCLLVLFRVRPLN